MPALAADWCCGDGTNKANTLTESKMTKNHNYKSDRSATEMSQQNENGIRYLNGNIPHQNGLDDDIPTPKVSLFDPSKLRLHWTQRIPVGAGLSNLGNTCFLNSVLQCLVYTPPLAHHLSVGEHKQICKVKDFCMLCILQDHLSRSLCGGKAFKPLRVLQNLRNIAKNLTWGQQEDAHEFLRYVVDSMQKSCLFGTNGLDTYSKETTLVYQVFSGYLRSQVKCLRCMHASNTYDPFLDISVDIKDVHSLEQALVKFVTPEKLDVENAYKCERCKVRVPAHKRFTVHRNPNVLTIHMKRFDMSRALGSKISRHIRFPLEINIRPYMSSAQGGPLYYVLYGVLVHSGFSCNSGHYYSYVKAPNGQWHCMNDSMVTVSSLTTVLDSEAYILFYVRSTKAAAKVTKPHTITRPVTQNGSGDHQTVRIIGPQRPKVDGTFAATKHPNGVSDSTAAVYDSPTASSDKVNGVKEKQTTSIASLKGKNITKVGVPSLVPAYMEPGDSDEDCSPTLQICEDSAEVATAESKESSGSMSNVQEADSRVVSHRFKPRSVLKTAPGLFGSTEKMPKLKDPAASHRLRQTVSPAPDGGENVCDKLLDSSEVFVGDADVGEVPDQHPRSNIKKNTDSATSTSLSHFKSSPDVCDSNKISTLQNGNLSQLSDNKPSHSRSTTSTSKNSLSTNNCSSERISNKSQCFQSPQQDLKTDNSKCYTVYDSPHSPRANERRRLLHKDRYSTSTSPKRRKHRSRSPHKSKRSHSPHRYRQSSNNYRRSSDRDKQRLSDGDKQRSSNRDKQRSSNRDKQRSSNRDKQRSSDKYHRSSDRYHRSSDRYRQSSNSYRRSSDRSRRSSDRSRRSSDRSRRSADRSRRSSDRHRRSSYGYRRSSDIYRQSSVSDRPSSESDRRSLEREKPSSHKYHRSSRNSGQPQEKYNESMERHGRSPIKYKERQSRSPLNFSHSRRSRHTEKRSYSRSRSRHKTYPSRKTYTSHHHLSSLRNGHSFSSPCDKQSYRSGCSRSTHRHSLSISPSFDRSSKCSTQSPLQNEGSHLEPTISPTAQKSHLFTKAETLKLEQRCIEGEERQHFSNGEHSYSSLKFESLTKQKKSKAAVHDCDMGSNTALHNKLRQPSFGDANQATCSSKALTSSSEMNQQLTNREKSFEKTDSNLTNGLTCSMDLQQP
ncbi:ubiquitin carboxyl-terminal hydrolase 36-like isoform X2 [Watersipora subatra]|uniref:ubiquitin carboxyl-terminal hydrolase 36-like isoform X2 n=1 Tax=Watersipora subatra TaxID=2589382 RepID=UPI00355B1F17